MNAWLGPRSRQRTHPAHCDSWLANGAIIAVSIIGLGYYYISSYKNDDKDFPFEFTSY
jgi:hypothetical protein